MTKVLFAAFLSSALGGAWALVTEKAPEAMIVHNVFFSLADNTPTGKENFVEACKKFLSKHEGLVFFAAGPRGEQFSREVNDQEFDVAITLVFKNKAAHDKYQDSEPHQQFIKEWKPSMKKVRVFDSLTAETVGLATPARRSPPGGAPDRE